MGVTSYRLLLYLSIPNGTVPCLRIDAVLLSRCGRGGTGVGCTSASECLSVGFTDMWCLSLSQSVSYRLSLTSLVNIVQFCNSTIYDMWGLSYSTNDHTSVLHCCMVERDINDMMMYSTELTHERWHAVICVLLWDKTIKN